jgi:2-polyprenyl-6-hydroxyphenyl methylase/3-demethylubiquinone-9 3-methyltransferase
MERHLFERLVSLPRLGSKKAVSCKICGGDAYFFDVVDFNKCCSQPDIYPFQASGIPVFYFRCRVCGFLFTKFFDDWTPQDFARFVYNEDYIKVDGEYAGKRPEREAAAMARRLHALPHLRILDYGSGSGLFANQLRSHGFSHVSSYDPFSSPRRPAGQFDVATCFEVLEHTAYPKATLADVASLLDPKGCLIFSTGIQPPTISEIRANWWYVAPRNGHVSIYSLHALARLGQAVNLVLHVGPGGTAFAGVRMSPASQQIVSLIGRPMQFFQLTAPDRDEAIPDEQKTSWHSVEAAGAATFRWTRESSIAWRLHAQLLPPCELVIDIPIANEIQPGFANQCRLEVGNRSAPFVRGVGVLTMSISIEEPVEAVVKLVLPPLLRPCDLRPVSDNRPLGLAISTRSAAHESEGV